MEWSRRGSERARHLAQPRCGPVRAQRRRAGVIGILVLAVGGLGTWKAVSAPENTHTVWAARRPLMPGQELRSDALFPVRVQLGSRAHLYASAEGSPANNRVLRAVEAGELVPKSALGQTSRAAPALVVIELGTGQEGTARSGGAVQVWIARRKPEGKFESPRLVVSTAYVGRVVPIHSKTGGPAGEGSSVELFVPPSKAAEIMNARNSKDRITLVPRSAK